VLVAPQMVIILVFFFWPAGQALFQSVLREDAFGTSSEFVGLENFRALFNDESTWRRSRPRRCSRSGSRCWG
jgi:sn-glycerol 3-phosphate transport system permease protein